MRTREMIVGQLASIIEGFEDDGMTVTMPNDVKEALIDEMVERICAAQNEVYDDMEMDVRQWAREVKL